MNKLLIDTKKYIIWKIYGFFISRKRIIKRNKGLRNRFKDIGRCFILATGPSINKTDLTKLKGEFLISVSNFFVHKDFATLKPRFHVFAKSHKPITKEQFSEWLEDAALHFTDPEINIVLSEYDRKAIKSNVFKDKSLHFYTYGGNFPANFSKALPPMYTVVHLAIYLAIYMGFKEIYLLGVDHDWILNYGKSRHFYQEPEHSLNRNSYNEWDRMDDIGNEFENYVRLWNIYRKIRNECKKNGIKIFNSTPGSLLDLFPFKFLDEI